MTDPKQLEKLTLQAENSVASVAKKVRKAGGSTKLQDHFGKALTELVHARHMLSRGKLAGRDSVARELLGAARILMGQEKRITKNTVKSVLKKLDLLDKAELSGTDVTFWPEKFSDDWHKGYDMAQHAAHTFSHVLDDLPVRSTGNHFTVRYKGEFIDMGDFDMPSSRWHY